MPNAIVPWVKPRVNPHRNPAKGARFMAVLKFTGTLDVAESASRRGSPTALGDPCRTIEK